MKSEQGSPIRDKESQEQEKQSETQQLPQLRVAQKHQVSSHNIYAENPMQLLADSMFAASVSDLFGSTYLFFFYFIFSGVLISYSFIFYI